MEIADCVHYLMNHGASTNIKDLHGNTAIHYLADAYNDAIYKVFSFIQYGLEGRRTAYLLASSLLRLRWPTDKVFTKSSSFLHAHPCNRLLSAFLLIALFRAYLLSLVNNQVYMK